MAYEISGREEVIKVLRGLYTREAACGGYDTMVTTFYPRDEQQDKRGVPSCRNSQSSVKNELKKEGDILDSEFVYNAHAEQLYSIKRVNSDESIDELSSDEDDDIFTSNERDTKREFSNRNVNSTGTYTTFNPLMHYLHEIGNTKTEQFFKDIENNEHSYHKSLSSSPRSSQLHKLRAIDTEDRVSSFPIQVLLYTATPDNDLYLGAADISTMARQIVNASGSAGSNVEYVTKTADFVRKYIPEDQDSHLFSLDAKVREEVYKQHAEGSVRLQLGFADLNHDLYEMDHDVLAEPVMAS